MPITGKTIPPPRTGAIVGRRQKTTLGLVQQLTRVSGGRGTVWTPGGPFIAPPGVILRGGVTGSGGIPAYSAGTLTGADVTEATISLTSITSATWATTATVFTGFNLSSNAVAANTNTLYALLWNIWICVWEDCPPPSS